MSKGLVFNLAKIALAATLLWYVVNAAGGVESIVAALSRIEREGWLIGLGLVLTANVLAMLRWHMLMKTAGLKSTPWLALRLGFLGVFFNNVVPGLTGGDLVKAVYVTRENPQQRSAAVVSVIVDRILGIVALAAIAAVVIPFDFERYGQAALGIYGFLGAAAIGGVFGVSRRAKAKLKGVLLRLGLSEKTPGASALAKLDQAVSTYRDRVGVVMVALVMSATVHMLIIVALLVFGQALSSGQLETLDPQQTERAAELHAFHDLGLDVYTSIVPIIMIISALPIAPAGWGVGEEAFKHFFELVGIVALDATALSLTYRLTAMLVSLLGGVFFVMDRKRVLEAASGDDDDPADNPAGPDAVALDGDPNKHG